MRAVVQVVKKAKLSSCKSPFSKIEKGFVVMLGIKDDDTEKDVEYLMSKIEKLRVFKDENGKLNLSLKDVCGSVLLVSNFTLYGTTIGFNRPSFVRAAHPEKSKPLYDYAVKILGEHVHVETGVFRTEMEIDLTLDGPCTILLDSEKMLWFESGLIC